MVHVRKEKKNEKAHTYEAVVGREDGVEGEHFGRRDVSLGCHVTGTGCPGGRGRVVQYYLSGSLVDVQHAAAVTGVGRTDSQHHVHLTECINDLYIISVIAFGQ